MTSGRSDPLERVAERIDRPPVGLDRSREVAGEGDVVPERQVENSVRCCCRVPQDVQVRPELPRSTARRRWQQRSSRPARPAGQADCLVPRTHKYSTVGAPIQPEAGDEDAHAISDSLRCRP